MYPIKVENITIGQQIELEEVSLITLIHVHTPTTHIGLIYGLLSGQNMISLNAVMFLQQLSQAAIDMNAYAQLSPEVKAQVKVAFIQRCRAVALNTTITWDDFMAERNVSNSPTGHNLLLRAMEVWEVESISFGGFSVIHLA
ncbi:hypothetical protein AN958_07396 [Leucoagaricus sp. SymC.cos]|nr:hypothetical protein AN958_07396 [Leucoagaricus sp. SymC.cos]